MRERHPTNPRVDEAATSCTTTRSSGPAPCCWANQKIDLYRPIELVGFSTLDQSSSTLGGICTPSPLVRSQVLYLLSYESKVPSYFRLPPARCFYVELSAGFPTMSLLSLPRKLTQQCYNFTEVCPVGFRRDPRRQSCQTALGLLDQAHLHRMKATW